MKQILILMIGKNVLLLKMGKRPVVSIAKEFLRGREVSIFTARIVKNIFGGKNQENKMCKKNNPRKIDVCMKMFIHNLKNMLHEDEYQILACCCGHGRYPMTIVVRGFETFEIFSGARIKRKKRFYTKDADGYFYIPEVSKPFRSKTISRRIKR